LRALAILAVAALALGVPQAYVVVRCIQTTGSGTGHTN
jgi:hypothetical protein